MRWPHDRKVTVIQSCYLVFLEAFRESNHACVNDSEVKIQVLGPEITDSFYFEVRRPLESPCARKKIVKELGPCLVKSKLSAPVVDLTKHEPGDN